MTEEFRAISQTIAEMAKDELATKEGGCFIMYAHEKTDDDQNYNTIKGAAGKNIDLMNGVISIALEILKQTPDQTARETMALSIAMSIMKHVNDLEEDEDDY